LREILAECSKRITSPYKLSILASKRARQLQMGAPPLVETKFKNYTNIALLEIAKGKVSFDNIQELEKTIDLRKLDAKDITFGTGESSGEIQTGVIQEEELKEMNIEEMNLNPSEE